MNKTNRWISRSKQLAIARKAAFTAQPKPFDSQVQWDNMVAASQNGKGEKAFTPVVETAGQW